MAKRDRLADRLKKLEVDTKSSSKNANSNYDSDVIVLDTSSEKTNIQQKNDNAPVLPSNQKPEYNTVNDNPFITNTPPAAPTEPTISVKELMHRKKEEDKAQKLLDREQKKKERFAQKQFKKAQREQQRQAELLQQQQIAQQMAYQLALKQQQEEAERAERARQAEIERQEAEKQAAIARAEAERQAEIARQQALIQAQQEQALLAEQQRLAAIQTQQQAAQAQQALLEQQNREMQLRKEQEEKERLLRKQKEEQDLKDAAERAEKERLMRLQQEEKARQDSIERAEKERLLRLQQEEKARQDAIEKAEKERQAELIRLEKLKETEQAKAERERLEAKQREEKQHQEELARAEKAKRDEEKKEKRRERKAKLRRYIDTIKERNNQRKRRKENRKLNRTDEKFHIFKKGSKAAKGVETVKRKTKGFFKAFTVKKVLAVLSILLVFVIALNQLPSLIYSWFAGEKKEEKQSLIFTVDDTYSDSIDKAIHDYPNEDFDNDLILNGLDEYPFDKDHDNNGIIDSDTSSTFALQTPIKVGDVVYEAKDAKCGVTQYLDYYAFNGLENEWVRVVDCEKYPYAYYDNNWHSVEYEHKDDSTYIKIPKNYCLVRLLESKSKELTAVYIFGKKRTDYTTEHLGGKMMAGFFTLLYPYNSDCPFKLGYREKYIEYFADDFVTQDRISSANVTKVNPNNLSRFSSMPIDDNDLAVIYNRIAESRASVISMQSDKGEILLIAYGYDYLGNLYVADYYDNEKKGKLNVTTQAKLIKTASGDYKAYSTVSFNGCGISSNKYKAVLVK